MRQSLIASIAVFSSMLIGCGPTSPEAARNADIAKCERQFGRLASDAAQGEALCTCLIDRLAQEGLEITDAFGSNRARVEAATRTCAARAGI